MRLRALPSPAACLCPHQQCPKTSECEAKEGCGDTVTLCGVRGRRAAPQININRLLSRGHSGQERGWHSGAVCFVLHKH